MSLEVGITQTVTRGLRALGVLTAIKFDNQLAAVARKVSDVRTDCCLTPEM